MKLIGLAGPAGVGKDTLADYLVATYNFTKFSFSDALYDEVAAAFGIDKAALYERSTKEAPTPALQYWHCQDKTFQNLMYHLLLKEGVTYAMDHWCSPRWVLQRWGTDYRRMQDPQYWIKRSALFVEDYLRKVTEDPETIAGGLVNCSVRFENERAFIKQFGGEIWHIRRAGAEQSLAANEQSYVSELGLPIAPEDKTVYNHGTIVQLGTAGSLLLSSPAGTSIRCEPVVAPIGEVTCVKCGWVHMGYTRERAEEEVAKFNEWYERQPPKIQDCYGGKAATVKDYEGCDRCGGKEFRPFTEGDCPDGCTIGPVIYEPDALPEGATFNFEPGDGSITVNKNKEDT